MNSDEELSYYIEIGAVELAGVDEDGEFIFEITEKAKELAPELWEAHTEHIDRSLMMLYQEGLIKISYDDNLEAFVEISEEGKKVAKELGLIEMEPFDKDIPND